MLIESVFTLCLYFTYVLIKFFILKYNPYRNDAMDYNNSRLKENYFVKQLILLEKYSVYDSSLPSRQG